MCRACVPGYTLLAYKCARYTAPINCFSPYANASHDPLAAAEPRVHVCVFGPSRWLAPRSFRFLEPSKPRTRSLYARNEKLTRPPSDTMGLCASHKIRYGAKARASDLLVSISGAQKGRRGEMVSEGSFVKRPVVSSRLFVRE